MVDDIERLVEEETARGEFGSGSLVVMVVLRRGGERAEQSGVGATRGGKMVEGFLYHPTWGGGHRRRSVEMAAAPRARSLGGDRCDGGCMQAQDRHGQLKADLGH
jgi:hypothetical protein